MPEVALRAGPVEYAMIEGDPELAPLVLLHEGLGCVALWRRFPAALAAATGRGVLSYSRYGYGASAPARLPRPVSYLHDEALAVLPELRDRLGLPEPVLLGHSDGASIALIHAARHAVAGLVLLAPHVFVEPETLTGIRAAAGEYENGALAGKLAAFHADPDAVFRGWSGVWLAAEFRPWSIEALLPAVSAPALVLQGELDQYGTGRQLDALESGLGGPVNRVELADCGHAPHAQEPERVLTEVGAFLRWEVAR
ncbi:alpha/beta fold hydrolase [Sciscionella marina]|uniref:alpha/beta fold hydrolase n=1 Tax=Sciscionella marina TaxID=508770 RepID=UPI000379E776|nr:alpha/beta fold hydrolase [Sciscionella marina]